LQVGQPGRGLAYFGCDLLAPPAQLGLLALERPDRFPIFFRIELGEP